jgi:segregation and condensation protein B
MEEDLRAIIEAMIFSSETPLSVNKIKDALGDVVEKSDILREIEEIREEHLNRAGGFTLEQVAGGFQFRTRPDLASWVRKSRGVKPGSLSPAAMETLAVIAYRQPVLKADIDRIRGVDVSGALKGLLEKKLIRMLGRKDVPGRPMMYGTSREFLEIFNLKDLSELPTLRELKELQDELGETGDIFAAAGGDAPAGGTADDTEAVRDDSGGSAPDRGAAAGPEEYPEEYENFEEDDIDEALEASDAPEPVGGGPAPEEAIKSETIEAGEGDENESPGKAEGE